MNTTTRLLVPYDESRHRLGDIGRTKFYELIEQKELTRVSIGRRGFITAESLEAYVQRPSETASGNGEQLALFSPEEVTPAEDEDSV